MSDSKASSGSPGGGTGRERTPGLAQIGAARESTPPAAPGLLSGDQRRPLRAPSHTSPPLPPSKATAPAMPRVSILLSKGQFWEVPQSCPQSRQGREGAASDLPPPGVPSPRTLRGEEIVVEVEGPQAAETRQLVVGELLELVVLGGRQSHP